MSRRGTVDGKGTDGGAHKEEIWYQSGSTIQTDTREVPSDAPFNPSAPDQELRVPSFRPSCRRTPYTAANGPIPRPGPTAIADLLVASLARVGAAQHLQMACDAH